MWPHVSAETLAEFREGDLKPRKSSRISAHLDRCRRCRALDKDFTKARDLALAEVPSLKLVLDQVALERGAINAHTDSLDTKAGLVLGFAGVLVGLSATAQQVDFSSHLFRVGLRVAVLAAVLAALALRPRFRYRPLNLDKYQGQVTNPEATTRNKLLWDQIAMVKKARKFSRTKQVLVFSSVVSLAVAAGLVVAGTLKAGGWPLFF